MRKPTRSTEACMHTVRQQLNSPKKIIPERKEGEKGQQTYQPGNDTCDEKGRAHCNRL
jgi:hypothetical protein